MGGIRNPKRYMMFISPCLMTLPFLIVFFADKCVNSPKTFSVGFLWGQDLPVRGDDDELVLILVRLYLSG